MKTVCFYFQVHQPMRLRRYRFFDIGRDHNYLDEPGNGAIMRKVADKCYLPMNRLLLRAIRESEGAFRVSFSMSGLAAEQFRRYAPEVLDSFRELAATGHVEFLGETYAHSLASLVDEEEFARQVKAHSAMIRREFGQKPTAFRNTELIYSDSIGQKIASMGFKTMLAEGARHVLGWRSPNFVYAGALDQKLRLLLRNYKLSDDIAFRFSDRGWDGWPLTVEKFLAKIAPEEVPGEVVGLFMDYETFGEHQWASTGIFDFMAALPKAALKSKKIRFETVSQASARHQPVAVLSSPHPMSWADEERDVTAWLGNELQDEAFAKLYAMAPLMRELGSPDYHHVWNFMQSSDHFYYMATKWLSDGDVHNYFNPYGSSYEAFVNYMNVLSDSQIQLARRAEEKKRAAAEKRMVAETT